MFDASVSRTIERMLLQVVMIASQRGSSVWLVSIFVNFPCYPTLKVLNWI